MVDENSKIIMNIINGMKYMDPLFKLTTMGSIMLIQFLARMVRERKLDGRKLEDFSEFIKATDGKYDIMNIPVMEEAGLSEELNQLGIRHMVLPDMNLDDGLMQVAVYQPDRDKFGAWFERQISSFMAGGEKELQDLQNLTKGRTSIVSFPLEGKDEWMTEDFTKMGINFASLRDLHVGDGSIQMVIANADMPKVEQWYKLKKEDLIKQGEIIRDFDIISGNQYLETGSMSESEYIENASPEFQEANDKYEGKEKGDLEDTVQAVSSKMQSENVVAYESFLNNPDFIPISIDHHSLIEKCSFNNLEEFQEHRIFACRVPGTWNSNNNDEKLLLIPLEQVFSSNDGKSYIAFMRKEEGPFVLFSRDGERDLTTANMTGKEFVDKTFKNIEEKFLLLDQDKSQSLGKAINLAGKEIKPLRIPANPVKAL